MKTDVVLEPLDKQTSFAPLCVLGYCLTRTGFLKPYWSQIQCRMKTREHEPVEKLQDLLVSILAGNESVSQINTHIRPDQPLADCWGRDCFAEQSSVARTLDALTGEQVEQLQQANLDLVRQYSRTWKHDFKQGYLLLDIDPTFLPASRLAEGSRKSYTAGKKNQYGRQWVRIGAPTYHETLCSLLFPGNQQGCTTLKPAVRVIQDFLGLSQQQIQRTILRSDASLGTDGNINWLLWSGYQVLMKGFSGSRAVSQAKRVQEQDWLADPQRKRWIARAPDPPRFAKRTRVFSLRWKNKADLRYGTLISSLIDLGPLSTLRLHDGRGAIEVEIKADKQGLKATKRRKKSLAAQTGLILLTDLAHNLLSWTHHWVLEGGPFDSFGAKRMVEELLGMPGRIEVKGHQLQKVALPEKHPYAQEMRSVVLKLLDFFGNP
ncbi:MAG: transposase [Anaerolineales bacterium]|jgi:hypothetical protein